MAAVLEPCPFCGEDFADKKERFVHLERWGCPVVRRQLEKLAAPYCACGCGDKTSMNKRKAGTFNKFIHGHNNPSRDR
jgi:hypothetical protein